MMLCLLALLLQSAGQLPQAETVWRDFQAWVQSAAPIRGGEHVPVLARYTEHLVQSGISSQEANRRIGLINETRVRYPQRQSVYYDAVYKMGGGPQDPIRYLVESARGLLPGKALDVAMGTGRNGLYLASLGWAVTGYDFSPEAVRQAREKAEALRVSFDAVLASHENFQWPREGYDLIVVSYASAWDWPGRLNTLWRSLRPRGVLVCDHACADALALFKERKPKGWRLLDYRDVETYNEGWGLPNTKVRRVQAIFAKQP